MQTQFQCNTTSNIISAWSKIYTCIHISISPHLSQIYFIKVTENLIFAISQTHTHIHTLTHTRHTHVHVNKISGKASSPIDGDSWRNVQILEWWKHRHQTVYQTRTTTAITSAAAARMINTLLQLPITNPLLPAHTHGRTASSNNAARNTTYRLECTTLEMYEWQHT